jgi:hypothetical protein
MVLKNIIAIRATLFFYTISVSGFGGLPILSTPPAMTDDRPACYAENLISVPVSGGGCHPILPVPGEGQVHDTRTLFEDAPTARPDSPRP